MKWFRLWTEIIDDPKLCQLTDAEHRRFIHCLALAAEQEKEGKINGTIEELAWRIRTKPQALKSTIEKLVSLNILKSNGNGLEFINWTKRQFRSDNSTERWRKFKSNVGANVGKPLAQTPPETEQSTETEQSPPIAPPRGFDLFWKAYPKKVGKGAAEKAWKKISKPSEILGKIVLALQWQKKSEQWTRDNGQFIPHPATYLNEKRWDDEREKVNTINDPWVCRNCGQKANDISDGLCLSCRGIA